MWKKAFALILTVAALYFLVDVLIARWHEVRALVELGNVITYTLAMIPVYVITAFVNAAAWVIAFRSTGSFLPARLGLRAHLLSQIGKYLPGNVGHFVGRLGLLKLANRSMASGSVSIVLEILWMLGAAATLSVYALFSGALQNIADIRAFGDWLPILVLVVALIAPNAMILLFNRLPAKLREKLGFSGFIRRPPEHIVLGCYGLYFLTFLLNGLILMAGFYWLFEVPTDEPLLVISMFAAAWLLGFILPGAPGGIGVREAAMVLLLGGIYGEGITAAMAIIMRFISVTGDLIAFGLGGLMSRRSPQVGS